MKIIKTPYRIISNDAPSYLIAEIGSNHNGSFDIATEMIERAVEAGVDAVKFQTFKASNHYSKNTPKISLYEEDIYSLIEKLEIDRTWHKKLAEVCRKYKIDFLDSPCDSEAVHIAVGVNMPIIKVASFDMVDVRLIEEISKTGKAVMFSAGMCTISEIETAVNICRKNNNDDIIILQCTSVYPAPVQLSNLRAMDTIRRAFDVITGYSDHTMGDHIACAAVALGAKVIEKHYTLDRTMKGPDHAFAIEPAELKQMVVKIREIESGLGDGIKNGPRAEEMEFYKNARRSILTARAISKGEVLKDSDLVIKRPGFGIQPSLINLVIGRTVQTDIEADSPITWEMI